MARWISRRDGRVRDSDARSAAPRPHVLFVIDQLCEAGGAERVLLNILRLLPEQGFRCSLVTFKLDSRVDLFRQIPCPVQVLPLRRTYGWSGLLAARRLWRLIRSQQVEIVHTFFETSDIWGGLVAKLSGCPILISSRRDMGILRSGRHQLAYRLLGPLFDQVLTVSDEVSKLCVRQDRLDPEKVVTVYSGIDLQKVRTANGSEVVRRTWGLAADDHLVTAVGHIRKVKGFDVFIRAAAIVRREFPKATFSIVGSVHEPAHLPELEELRRSLGLTEAVRFAGSSDNILSVLKASDVYCLPSRSEGFSNALLEAMACGLPCVATRVGGNAEAIEDGVSGFIVPPEAPEPMADRILRLLRQPQEARRMGHAARQRVEEKFTAEAMMANITAIYDRLLSRSSAPKSVQSA